MSTLIIGPTTSGKTTRAKSLGKDFISLDSTWIPRDVRERILHGEDLTLVINSGLFDEIITTETKENK